jgi:hypothetical protein
MQVKERAGMALDEKASGTCCRCLARRHSSEHCFSSQISQSVVFGGS